MEMPKTVDEVKKMLVGRWSQWNNNVITCVKQFNEDGLMSYGKPWKVNDDLSIEFDGHVVMMHCGNGYEGPHMSGLHNCGTKLFYVKTYDCFPEFDPIAAVKIRLFVQTYKSLSDGRQSELDICLHANKNNKLLDVIEINKQDRLTYSEFISEINNRNRLDGYDDCVSIIANSDIVFDDTIKLSLNMSANDVYCLAKYNNGKLHWYPNSQDSWVFRGKIKKVNNVDFYIGTFGCDNAFANRLRQVGYNITNPSKSIITNHVHKSEFRTYSSNEMVAGPWNHVWPCSFDKYCNLDTITENFPNWWEHDLTYPYLSGLSFSSRSSLAYVRVGSNRGFKNRFAPSI